MLTRLGRMRNITMPIFFKTGLSKAEIMRLFDFPNGCCRHLLFLESTIFWQTVSRGSRLMGMSNFGKIGQSVAKILIFFNFSKWRASPSWIFKFVKLLADSVWKAQTHHRAKCRQNWSSCFGDIAFFRIFKMADAAILDF